MKIICVVDPYGVVWAMDAVDTPGKAGTGMSYFKAISPLLERHNATGYTSDWPSVMQNAAKRVKAHFDGKTHNPCSFHGMDTASPPGAETPMYKSALAAITEVIRHFKTFDRPRGLLRRMREVANEKERAAARDEKRVPKLIPTLQYKGATRKLSAINPFRTFLMNIELLKRTTLHPDYKSFVADQKSDSAAMTSIHRTQVVIHDFIQVRGCYCS